MLYILSCRGCYFFTARRELTDGFGCIIYEKMQKIMEKKMSHEKQVRSQKILEKRGNNMRLMIKRSNKMAGESPPSSVF
jgi:hypothetical protein